MRHKVPLENSKLKLFQQQTIKQHISLRTLSYNAYNDFLARSSINGQNINPGILNTDLEPQLNDNFNHLEFYTDGSLIRDIKRRFQNEIWMIFTTNIDLDIKYSRSTVHCSSSTKAKTVAILTALIVYPIHVK
ncbi:unnamed protein product [Rhizophagus irregularis]|nr:unnamed protein product [Rhizophagus irregularis]